MKVIAIVNQKGGVAKTTTACETAAGLALRGHSTLLVDLDQQANATSTVMEGLDQEAPTMYDVLTGAARMTDAIQPTQYVDGLDLAPADIRLATLDIALAKQYKHPADVLKRALRGLDYDYVIVDTPPALSQAVVNALVAADWLVVPAEADTFSPRGLVNLYTQAIKGLPHPPKVAGILLSRYNRRRNLDQDISQVMDGIAAKLGTSLFKARIRPAVAVREAELRHKPVQTYKPKSAVAGDFSDYIDELIERTKQK